MTGDTADIGARRRRAIFRAGHRGTRELDWLLGRFADAEVEKMAPGELKSFEELLALPDPDIERWLLHGATPRPDGAVGDVLDWLRRFHSIDG